MLSDENIRIIFSDLNKAIKQKDMKKILSYYNQEDKILYERTKSSYLQWIENKDIKYNQKILDISKSNNEITIILSQVIEYHKDDLIHHNPQFSKIQLGKKDNDWKIIDKTIFQIAENVKTSLDISLNLKYNKMDVFAYLTFNLLIKNLDTIHIKLNRGLEPTEIFDNNNKRIQFLRIGDSIELNTKDVIVDKNSVALKIRYNGVPYNSTGKFGYKIIHIGKEGSYASFVSNWYPQIGFTKTTGKISFNVPDNFVVTCTGKEIDRIFIDNRINYHFQVDVPHIYSFAAANYYNYSENIDGIKFGSYILKEDETKAKFYLQKTIDIISFLKKEIFGIYPYENYSIVEIPAEIAGRTGGMSEQGMNFYPDNSLNENYVNIPIFAHEIGHLWWGNWVIGDLIFLSEGLANIAYALCLEKFYGEEIMRKFLIYGALDYFQAAYYYFASVADRDNKDMKIGINDWGRAMDLHLLSNTKGFFVLLMLRDVIGNNAFYKGFQSAIEKYAHTFMKLEELQKEFEYSSGQDLKWFFDQWFFRTGAPEFRLEYKIESIDKDQYKISGTLKQIREIYKTKIEIEIVNGEHKITKEILSENKITNFEYMLDFEPKSIVIDPNYKVFRWTDEFKKLSKFGDAMINRWISFDKCKE